LNEINELCKKHKVRLFLDESVSFAALGDTGRGITEHLGVDPADIDFICGSMEHGLGAFGGFITGSEFVVDHQRISGLGYCFSASLPPFLAGVGILALKKIDEHPEIIHQLQENCAKLQKLLEKMKYFNLTGYELSPLKFLSLQARSSNRKSEQVLLDEIITYVKDNHSIALIQPSYLEDEENKLTAPCIRIAVNRLLTEEEMKKVVLALEEAYEICQPTSIVQE
jgi:serine palmitoyltransferase